MQVSISLIFYEQIFGTKVFCAPFMCIQFRFAIFWQKDFGTNAANKMLVKLTPGHCYYDCKSLLLNRPLVSKVTCVKIFVRLTHAVASSKSLDKQTFAKIKK
jgi:hypothetical protein